MVHASESGVQLSGDAEMKTYCDQEVASNQFCCKHRDEPSTNFVIAIVDWYNWQGQREALGFVTTFKFRSSLRTVRDNVRKLL